MLCLTVFKLCLKSMTSLCCMLECYLERRNVLTWYCVRTSIFDIQHQVRHPPVVPGNWLEPSHTVVLQRLLSALLFSGIHSRQLPHVWRFTVMLCDILLSCDVTLLSCDMTFHCYVMLCDISLSCDVTLVSCDMIFHCYVMLCDISLSCNNRTFWHLFLMLSVKT